MLNMNKLVADKVLDKMPNGDGFFMGVNLREFSKKQLIKIMCMDHEAYVREMTRNKTGNETSDKVDCIKGIKTTINFSGDLQMSPYWKQWTVQDVFTCERYTKSGLVLLIDPDGAQVSVSKSHCNALLAKK